MTTSLILPMAGSLASDYRYVVAVILSIPVVKLRPNSIATIKLCNRNWDCIDNYVTLNTEIILFIRFRTLELEHQRLTRDKKL
ncbi:MAG: hypothetical protein RSE13_06515 [Planktothrix sp. GU0601_MAG3]|nr:MAG: hypothetical protein RSE13_06515 [Planktothrix sp. GU0601_MAG3]